MGIRHKKDCKDDSGSCLKYKNIVDISQAEVVKIRFEEFCNGCGAKIGTEIQVFKFSHIDIEGGFMEEKIICPDCKKEDTLKINFVSTFTAPLLCPVDEIYAVDEAYDALDADMDSTEYTSIFCRECGYTKEFNKMTIESVDKGE